MKILVTLSMIIIAASALTIKAQLVQLKPEELQRPSPTQESGRFGNITEMGLHKLTSFARYLEKKADALNEHISSTLGVSPKTTATGVAIATTVSPLGIFTGGVAPAATAVYAIAKHVRDKWSSMNETQKKAAIAKVQDLVEEASDELNEAEAKAQPVTPTPPTASSARRSRFIV